MTGLSPEVAVLGISIGLLFALGCYLSTNLSPGGMITPGWLALLLVNDARRALLIAGIIVVTYFVMRGLQRVVILYGKRLFAAVVACGVFLQMTAYLVLLESYPVLFSRDTLGFIVPGLVAYQLIRQPVAPTLVATIGVTALTYVVMLTGVLLRFIQ